MFGPYPAVVRDWHDGDTCHCDVDLGFGFILAAYDLDGKPKTSCRTFGINAPEIGTVPGVTAKFYAMQICPAGTHVSILSHGWDKYGGRFDGSIALPNGRDFGETMLEAGMAVEYKG